MGIDQKTRADERAEIDAIEVEELQLQRYMDPEDAQGEFSDQDYIRYLRLRYQEIRSEHRVLLCNQKEAEESARGDMLPKIQAAMRANYKSRKYFVHELRKRGEKVEDRYVI